MLYDQKMNQLNFYVVALVLCFLSQINFDDALLYLSIFNEILIQ